VRTGIQQNDVDSATPLLRRAADVVGRWIERVPHGGARHRAAAGGVESLAAPSVVEQAATAKPAPPDALAYGQPFATPKGLELTVTAVGLHESDPRHVVLDVRVTNVSDQKTTFENDFGVLDAAGAAHRYTWVNAATYPGVLPGIATLEPGTSLTGKVHVRLPELAPEALAVLRPAFLDVVNAGCGGCNHEVLFLPRAVWQPSALPQ
jgi:hypothetical protein